MIGSYALEAVGISSGAGTASTLKARASIVKRRALIDIAVGPYAILEKNVHHLQCGDHHDIYRA